MHAFVERAIVFAYDHALLAYALALLLATAESLPVIGAMVPGTAAIIALAALIAAGALEFWPFAAMVALGALLGDGLAYWLGHHYQGALLRRWPFSRHPEIAARGEDWFRRHGAQSVFIARFTPGVRNIVPILAGILRMRRLHFFVPDIAAAIIWAVSHVLFGVLVGASLELLGAVAGRLAVLAGLLLVLAYAVVLASRVAARRLPQMLSALAEPLADWARRNPGLVARLISRALAADRAQALGLALSVVLLAAGLWLLLGAVQDVIRGSPLARVDGVVLHALATLRSEWADGAMRVLAATGSRPTLAVLAIGVLLALVFWRQWAYALAWVLGLADAFGLGILLGQLPHPALAAMAGTPGLLGNTDAMLAATAYGLLAFLFFRAAAPRWQPAIVSAASLLVVFGAVARLYLNRSLFSTEIIAIAFALAWIGLIAFIALYKRLPPMRTWPVVCVVVPVLVAAIAIQTSGYHLVAPAASPPAEPIQAMTLADWRAGGWDDLPGSRVGLLGNFTRPFTLQWAGSIPALAGALEAKGWRVPPPWTLSNALTWLASGINPASLSVLPHFADGRPQALVLVLVRAAAGKAPARLVLRLWPSNTVIVAGDRMLPLWLGSLVEERFLRIAGTLTIVRATPAPGATFSTLAAAVPAGEPVADPDGAGPKKGRPIARDIVLLGWSEAAR